MYSQHTGSEACLPVTGRTRVLRLEASGAASTGSLSRCRRLIILSVCLAYLCGAFLSRLSGHLMSAAAGAMFVV
jgi:hypothetical protein